MKLFFQVTTSLIAFLSLFTLISFPAFLVGRLIRQPDRSFIRRTLEIASLVVIMPLMPVKIIVGAYPVFLALLAGFGVIAGFWFGDWLTVLAALVGTVFFTKYCYAVTRPVPGIDQVFDPGQERIVPREAKLGSFKTPYRFPWSEKPPFRSLIRKDVPIPVGDKPDQFVLCDIWETAPECPRSGLAVIHLHATAWQGMDKGQLVKDLFSRINAQGHLVLDLAYSLAPGANMEQMVHEVKNTIGWLKSNAKTYQINPEKIVMMGESGGGHLALLAAYTQNRPEFDPPGAALDTSVCGVITIHAPTDLRLAFEEYGKMEPAQPEYSYEGTEAMQPKLFNKTALDRWITRMRLFPEYRYQNLPGGILLFVNLVGGTLKEIPEKYAQYSPLTHVDGHSPPTLYLTGGHDWYYQAPYGEMLHQALLEAGARSSYYSFPNTDHGFLLYFPRLSPAAQTATHAIVRFLELLV